MPRWSFFSTTDEKVRISYWLVSCGLFHFWEFYGKKVSIISNTLLTYRVQSSFAIVDALKYAGFQIAYLLGGWLVNSLLLCIICLFITLAIVLPVLDVYSDWFFEPWLLLKLYPIGIGLAFYILQVSLYSIPIFFSCITLLLWILCCHGFYFKWRNEEVYQLIVNQ